MGSIIHASCQCGYEKTMFLGGGMANFTTYCGFPCFCEKCRLLFDANLFVRVRCPECGQAAAIPYDDSRICLRRGDIVFSWNVSDQFDRELILTDGDYLCPKCEGYTLTFADVGNWD